MIAEHDSTNPLNGYNHSTGGDNASNGRILSDQSKQKISCKLTGRKLSESTRKKQSDSKIGTKGDKVQCIETGKVYRNAQAAQRETGIYFRTIQRAASGCYKTAGGYHWKFVDVEKVFVPSENHYRGKTVTLKTGS